MSAPEEGGPLAPRQNPNFCGHEQAERALLDGYLSGRLAHAWLLSGPRGIGKATLAYRFARFVLSQPTRGAPEASLFGPPTPPKSLEVRPDDRVFRRVASGGHADLLTVERQLDERGRLKTEIVVADARAISDFLHLTPIEGGWRIVVIDGAEEMNRNAANAVLKIIEEPPRQALILMVSHAPGRLLATIRSRCRRLSLKSLDEATLLRILSEARADMNAEEVRILARLAEGSVGRAIELAGQGGLALFREMIDMLGTLPELDVVRLHRLAERSTGQSGEEAFRTTFDLFLWWLARHIRAIGTGEAPNAVIDGERALNQRLAAVRGLERWLRLWENTRHLLARAESINLGRKQVVLNAFLALEATVRA